MGRVLAYIFFAVIIPGCGFIFQETLVLEIDASRLSCATNPEIIDGDLGTGSVLAMTQGVARGAAGVLIKLDQPTYIKHIEIYTRSRMTDVRIYTSAKEGREQADIVFDSVRGYSGKDGAIIPRGQMKRFRIGRQVLYLKLLAGWTIDGKSGRRIEKSTALGYDRVLPMQCPFVNEVRFYTVEDH